jgi:hypothetical protein
MGNLLFWLVWEQGKNPLDPKESNQRIVSIK